MSNIFSDEENKLKGNSFEEAVSSNDRMCDFIHI